VLRTKVDISGFVSKVKGLRERDIPYVTSLALNNTAGFVIKAISAEMPSIFDRPVPYTLRALTFDRATKQQVRTTARVKNTEGGRALSYLNPEVYGGSRSVKAFERLMRSSGAMPTSMFMVPGPAAKLDSYGNVSRGQLVQIISYFRSFGTAAKRQNMTDKRRSSLWNGRKGANPVAGKRYFALPRKRGRLPPGIYEVANVSVADRGRRTAEEKKMRRAWASHFQRQENPRLVFAFVTQPTYRAIFDFHDLAYRLTINRFPIEFRAAANRVAASNMAKGWV
jgi:hypothetical protein